MDFSAFGKWLIVGGFVLVGVGVAVYLLGRLGIPFGGLPGDIHVQGERSSFHFPVVSSIVLSIVLTVVLNLVLRFFR